MGRHGHGHEQRPECGHGNMHTCAVCTCGLAARVALKQGVLEPRRHVHFNMPACMYVCFHGHGHARDGGAGTRMIGTAVLARAWNGLPTPAAAIPTGVA
eukprot:363592-Chlamydomonas_euryale.AAC.2